MIENWKVIPGYDMYEVSTHGQVRSWKNAQWGRRKESRMLKPTLGSTSYYPMVSLCKNGRCKSFYIHMLVLTAFVGPRPPDKECCHGDGEHTNNLLDNLRWDSHSANTLDAIAHGTMVPLQGEANGRAKLTETEIAEIRRIYAVGGISQRELGTRFDVDHGTVGRIIRREIWTHISMEGGGE